MRKCASCGRELGVAFATSPVCPCCDGLIAGGTRKRSALSPPAELYPPFAESFARIIARAAEAAAAAPNAAAAQSATAYVGPGGVAPLPVEPAADVHSGTLQMSSKEFASLSGEHKPLPADPEATGTPATDSPAKGAVAVAPTAGQAPTSDTSSPSDTSATLLVSGTEFGAPPAAPISQVPTSPAPASIDPRIPADYGDVGNIDLTPIDGPAVKVEPPSEPKPPSGPSAASAAEAASQLQPPPKEKTPTHLLHTQTFSAPLLPPDGSSIPLGVAGASASGLSPADVDRMSQLWSGTIAGSAHERMTMIAGSGVEEIPSLMVSKRVLQQISGGRSADADYQLLEMIGEGGIGMVYAARQASIDRTVAVKMLKSEKVNDRHQRAKFLSEAVITGELDHPNIVPIYDLGASQQGSYFYSMKRVVGTPWNKVLGSKPLAENIEILMKVADAVAFAHSRGVVHRDLKPENVMLGSFGEVLLMDWGLALLAGDSRKITVADYDPGMGGTPAYMAPEMATGPIASIDARSDVYLLGAILFEMVVGRPPHTGPNVMGCLFAAARNEIVPTDHDGELMKIARRSMLSSREDRYASVKDFQTAIREYQSHAEAIVLAVQAQEDLTRAGVSQDYQDYARAMFGFQQALGLWSGSEQATAGIRSTKTAYAEAAMKKGDYDLALSLLDAGDSRDDETRTKATAGRLEREQRQQRLTAAKRMAVGLAVLVIVVVTGAFFQISRDRNLARDAETAAKRDKDAAEISERKAKDLANVAAEEAQKARDAEGKANVNLAAAEAAQQLAQAEAKRAREASEAAEEAKRAETYETYVARIGLAAAKIEENSFGSAEALLDSCEKGLRRWEWGRLMYLCSRHIESYRADGPIDCVAFSPDGKRAASASWDKCVRIWNLTAKGEPPVVIPYGSDYVHAVAFSPDGADIAIGGSDPTARVQICDAMTGRVKQVFEGHEDSVLGVSFSRDGKRLLTCSYDKTVRLWNIQTKIALKCFEGHAGWVWSAAFAPPPAPNQPETRIVSAGQDGSAIVWDIETEKHGTPFVGHKGPVYSAAFSPDGKYVVSAGDDNRVLVWDPADVRPVDISGLIAGKKTAGTKFTAFDGHDAPVRSVGYSPDGTQIVSAGNDNTIKVWNVAAGKLEKTIRGHGGWVRSCVYSHDGTRLLSGSHDRRMMYWDVGRYHEETEIGSRQLKGHSDAVLQARFSPDDQWIVTGARDHSARVWRAADGKPTETKFVEGHEFLVSQAAFLPKTPACPEGRIVTAGIDNTFCVWDIAGGHQLFKKGPAGRAGAVSAAPDGSAILTGDGGTGAILWNAETGALLRTLTINGDEIVWTAFSPSGAQLFTGDAFGRCRLWSRTDDKSPPQELISHDDRITGAVFSADGSTLLTSSADYTVEQWDLKTARPTGRTLRHPEPVSSLAATADGKIAVTTCNDGRIRIWDVDQARVTKELPAVGPQQIVSLSHDGLRVAVADAARRTVRVFKLDTLAEIAGDGQRNLQTNEPPPFLELKPRSYLVWSAIFSADDQELLTIGGDGAKLWDADDGTELKSFGPQGAIASVDYAPDGKRVVTGSWDQSAKIWDAETGKSIRRLAEAGSLDFNSVRYSPDGRLVLVACGDGKARLWIAETGEFLKQKTFAHEVGPLYSAEFSRDGAMIVTCGEDKTARLWNASTGKLLHVLTGHSMAVRAVTFSRDGKLVVTGSDDRTAIVWDVDTGKAHKTLEGHTAGVTSVALTLDGDRVLTGSRDNLAKLWDSQTGKEILTLKKHKQEVSSTVFSHDGRDALTAGRDGTAILWPAIDWLPERPSDSLLAPDAATPPTSGRSSREVGMIEPRR